MNYIVINTKNQEIVDAIHEFECHDKCNDCLMKTEDFSNVTIKCPKGNIFLKRYDSKNNLLFIFCAKNNGRNKIAKLKVAQLVTLYTREIQRKYHIAQIDYQMKEIAFHNSKNILAQINAKLNLIFPEKEMITAQNKIDFINEKIMNNKEKVSRELLSLMKSVQHMISEFHIFEYLEPGAKLTRSQLLKYKIHSIIVTSWYLYEPEFKEKKIWIKTDRCDCLVYVNFELSKTVFSQLFTNILKYTKPETEVHITFIDKGSILIINMEMISVKVDADEIEKIYSNGYRGRNAIKLIKEGKGIGLRIIKSLLKLLNGEILFIPDYNTEHELNNIIYCKNIFTVTLPK